MSEKTVKKRKWSILSLFFDRKSTPLSHVALFWRTRNRLAQSKPDWRWQLTASGRFAHRKEYVQSVGEAHSLKLIHYEPMTDFRFENGVGVQGHIFVMQKQTSNGDQEL